MATVPVKVVVDDEHLDAVKSVVLACEQAGLEVEQVFEEIGTIFGRADEGVFPSIARAAGVHTVAREASFQLPPLSEHTPQ